MTYARLPRQDSTACQLRDLEMEARNRAMCSEQPLRAALEEGVQWMVRWAEGDRPEVSPEGLRALRRVAIDMGCYDADDAILRRAG